MTGDIADESGVALGTVKAGLAGGRAALALLLADRDGPEVEADRG
ncbi:hypothetical protein AB0J74_29615 [Asanoa sp. NPDC049573]